MVLGPEVRVGLIVFIAIVALISVYMFVGGRAFRAGNYEVYAIFEDVRRLDTGAEVRMAGVKIGLVQDISLTRGNLAKVKMTISRRARIPVGSRVQITSGTLIGDTYVEIIPGPSDAPPIRSGSTIPTEIQARFEDMLPKLDTLLVQLQETVESVNGIIGDEQTVTNIKKALTNLEAASREAAVWMAEMRDMTKDNRNQLEQSLANLSGATRSFQGLMQDLRTLATGNAKKDVEIILANVKSASDDLDATMQDVRRMTSELKTQDLGTILANVHSASENLDKASQGIAKIATDEKMAEDIRAAVSNVREAAEQTKELATKINRKIGGEKRQGEKKPNPVRSGLRTEVLQRMRSSDLRVDVDWTIPWRDRTFYRVGARDIGESTGLNLHVGRMLGKDSDFRYGLYASKVGIGYDYRVNDRTTFGLDLYRPNDPDMELRLTHRPTKDWEIIVGMDRAFDDAGFLLGLGFKK